MNRSHHDNQHTSQDSRSELRTEEMLLELLAADASGEDCDASHLPSFAASLYPRMPV